MLAAATSNDSHAGGSTGGSGAGFGGAGGGTGGGGGGHGVTSSLGAAYSKQQEAGLTFPPSSPAFGVPSSGVGGTDGYQMVSPPGWNYTPNGTAGSAGRPEVGNAEVGSGIQYGASGPGLGGNVNYLCTPGGSSGTSANAGMPVSGSGVDGTAAGGHGAMVDGGVNTANMDIGSTAGTNAAGGGFSIPDCHNPLAGAVPVLLDVSVHLLLYELQNVFFYFRSSAYIVTLL